MSKIIDPINTFTRKVPAWAVYLLLTLPPAREACMIGMAPTTSTTLTLAMGDALAVALMEQRGFVAAQFRTFHPGGKLGARLSRVSDLMHVGTAIPLVRDDADMADALIEISSKGFGVTAVLDTDNRLTGIITTGDLGRHIDGLMSLKARDVMTRDPVTIEPLALAEKAVGAMNTRKITCLLVVDPAAPDTPAGLLHLHDCLRAGVA